MAVILDDRERAVLERFKTLGEADAEGAWAAYTADIASAAGGFPLADGVCRNLRRRKLLEGQGRGRHAAYWISEKGKEALADAAA